MADDLRLTFGPRLVCHDFARGVRWEGPHANCRHHEIALRVLYEAVMATPLRVEHGLQDALNQAEKALGLR